MSNQPRMIRWADLQAARNRKLRQRRNRRLMLIPALAILAGSIAVLIAYW